MDGYKQLAAAIVEKAVVDYRTALKTYDDSGINHLERFFRSEWFTLLSDMNGDVIIGKVRKIVKEA